MTGTISPADFSEWRDFVGRTETVFQEIDAVSLVRYLRVLGETIGAAPEAVPEMAHWAYFLPMTSNEDLGPDGHVKRGSFPPGITLSRRMFAGGSTRFLAPLLVGHEASCRTRIADVSYKSGRTGDLVFVELERALSQSGRVCLIESQTIVYRGSMGVTTPVEPSDPAAFDDPVWTPSSVDLFRFSAVTFNAHRIHYDLPYATGEEGYPGLVVHGPLTASMLCRLCARTVYGRSLTEFAFRATAPLFVGQPVRLRAHVEAGTVKAVALRQDGQVAVTAKARFAPTS